MVVSTANVSTTGVFGRKRGAAAIAVGLIVASVLTMATSVAAQPGPAAACTGAVTTTFGTQYYGYDDFDNRLLSTSILSREFALSTPLEPGSYVLDAVSYDGYPGRETIAPQSGEQWYAELVTADGTIVATSGVTGDLADEVEEATWSGALGEVTIDQKATTIRTVHAAPGSPSVNSVRPVCVGATRNEPAPTIEPAPGSTITVDFDSTADVGSSVVLRCGDIEESATGTSVDLVLRDVAAGAGCAVQYPSDLVCSVALTPESDMGEATEGGVDIRVPEVGGADILVDIDCERPQVAGVATTTTTTAPAAVDTEVEAKVEAKVETKVAPTAQVQPGTPAFTG